jgi:hypothetical protein
MEEILKTATISERKGAVDLMKGMWIQSENHLARNDESVTSIYL